MNNKYGHRKRSKENRQKNRSNASNLKNSNERHIQAEILRVLSRSNNLRILHDQKFF